MDTAKDLVEGGEVVTLTLTPAQIEDIFTLWEVKYSEDPDAFFREGVDEKYGPACAGAVH